MQSLALNSRNAARTMLSAWSSAGALLIRRAADRADALQPASTLEEEQIEMLREACAVLRGWTEGRDAGADLDAALGVLRHLAGGAVREAVLPETPACVRC